MGTNFSSCETKKPKSVKKFPKFLSDFSEVDDNLVKAFCNFFNKDEEVKSKVTLNFFNKVSSSSLLDACL